jgi:hypothetical protein
MAKKGGPTKKGKKSTPKKVTEVTFTEAEREALREIITDWIEERIVASPYSPEIASVIRKLGIPGIQQPSATGQAASTAQSAAPEGFEHGPAPLIPNLG